MKTTLDSIMRASARAAFIAAASFAMLASLPVVAGAQGVVRVPPTTVQVPGSTIQVPPVTVQLPDSAAGEALRLRLEAMKQTLDLSALSRLDALKDLDLAKLDLSLAELQAQQGRIEVRSTPFVYMEGASGTYESGLNLLDNERWQLAIDRFDRVIKIGKTHVDGAMYWKAYAQGKLGQQNDALATLQALQKGYPNSRYLDDAKALEIEVRKSAGQPVRPEDQSDQELKLIALNSIMRADPDRGIPLVEQILKGRGTPKVKQQALFLLSTNDSPKARDVLAGIARGEGNPDLQMKAIRYLSMRAATNSQLLADIYASSKDADVKRQIIRSLGMARDIDRLLNIAKTEPSAELRAEAIRQLGMRGAGNQLSQLYAGEKEAEIRSQIISQMTATGNLQRAAELAKQEADAKVRAKAVRNLGTADKEKTGDALVQIYKSDKDKGVKDAVINALYIQQNAKALVDLARQESDPSLKKDIVSRLSTMKAKEATDYMLELLK